MRLVIWLCDGGTALNMSWHRPSSIPIFLCNVASEVSCKCLPVSEDDTAWKVSKYGNYSDPYFSAFGLNAGKNGLEKTQYLDTFHVV